MATKVKGDKIKEGSIPLSALAEDVKENLMGKYGLSGYCGTLGRDNKTVDTNAYFRSVVYIKYGNWIANASIGTYSIHELFPSSAPIPGNIVVYAKGEKLSLDLQEDSNYWDNLKVFGELYEVPIPTPDWNAQEGEAGYIENKPFGDTINKQLDVSDFTYDEDESVFVCVINNQSSFIFKVYEQSPYDPNITVDTAIYKYGTYFDKYELDFTIRNYIDDPNVHIDFNGYHTIKISTMNEETLGECLRLLRYCDVYEYNENTIIRQIYDMYLPNTVIKTTPQTLSDSDKNQALANLGIDPVVWKYMCEPYNIRLGDMEGTLPEELVSIIFDDNYDLKPITLKLIVLDNIATEGVTGKDLFDPEGNNITITTDGSWYSNS